MRTGVGIVLMVVVALLSAPGASSAAPLPSDFFGVSSPDLVPLSTSQRDAVVADQRAAGVRLLRQLFDWSQIETNEGTYSWSDMDGFMTSAARAGMKVLPVVLWSPDWASTCSGQANSRNCPPDPTDFGNFVATLIGRYGPNGSFWSANPTVPKVPITAWQLWNEPALPVYWGGSGATPSPSGYVQLLQGAVPIIRAADPHAEIVAAGIPQSSLKGAISMNDYVSGMYAAGLKGLVDDVALHLYDDTPDNAVGLVEQVRAIMNSNGDSATPIWATEWGWASAGKPNKFVTDLPGQAANVDALMGALVARHEELNVRGLTEYFWHDGSAQTVSGQTNASDIWDNHLGLVYFGDSDHAAYSHKPAWAAFQGRAIDTTPPDTTIDSASAQSVAFSSTQAGSDFECLLDDTSWTACTSPYAIGPLAPGTHTLEVRATDPYGNTDLTPATAAWQVAAPAATAVKGVQVASPPRLGPGLHALVQSLRRLHLADLARRHALSVSLRWPAAGRITLALRAHGVQIARGSRLVRHGGRARLVLKLSVRGRRLLAHSRRLSVALSELFRPLGGGPSASAHTSFLLRR